jgi:hypothetical protein
LGSPAVAFVFTLPQPSQTGRGVPGTGVASGGVQEMEVRKAAKENFSLERPPAPRDERREKRYPFTNR